MTKDPARKFKRKWTPPISDPTDVASDVEALTEDAPTEAQVLEVPLPPAPTGPKRGKPRRSDGIANHRSVRIDAQAEESLVQHFGTLGNALYHTFRGVQALRAQTVGLREVEPEAPIGPPPVTVEDWDLLTRAFQVQIDILNKDIQLDAKGKISIVPTAKHLEAQALELAFRRLELAVGRSRPRGRGY